MHELGYLENPDYYMGMLDAQALRSVRVIIDIGMHLEKQIPHDSEFHPGEIWTPELALEFMRDCVFIFRRILSPAKSTAISAFRGRQFLTKLVSASGWRRGRGRGMSKVRIV